MTICEVLVTVRLLLPQNSMLSGKYLGKAVPVAGSGSGVFGMDAARGLAGRAVEASCEAEGNNGVTGQFAGATPAARRHFGGQDRDFLPKSVHARRADFRASLTFVKDAITPREYGFRQNERMASRQRSAARTRIEGLTAHFNFWPNLDLRWGGPFPYS